MYQVNYIELGTGITISWFVLFIVIFFGFLGTEISKPKHLIMTFSYTLIILGGLNFLFGTYLVFQEYKILPPDQNNETMTISYEMYRYFTGPNLFLAFWVIVLGNFIHFFTQRWYVKNLKRKSHG